MDMRKTIPVAQALARGEHIAEEDFEGLRSVSTATLAGFDLGKPLVCAINGHARAGGFDLMLASEMRFAVPHATFALEEVAIGLIPPDTPRFAARAQMAGCTPCCHGADHGATRLRDRSGERDRRTRALDESGVRGR
jgi:enoyl-CoA hydratase/carnithine racemase